MEKREKFASRLGFLLISAGCAIGIGNVWRFPYITGQYGGAAFLLCGAAVELGGPNGRIVRKRHFECLFQRQRPPLLLCGELHDGRQGEHNQRDFFHIFYTYDVAKIEIIRFKCIFVRTKRTFLVHLVHFFSIRGDRGGR